MQWKETDLQSICGYGRGLLLEHSTGQVWLRNADSHRSTAEATLWQIGARVRHPFAPRCQAELDVASGGCGQELFRGSVIEAQIRGEEALRFLCGWVGMKLPAEASRLYDA